MTSKEQNDGSTSDKNLKITLENKCSFCTQSICCTYITHQIDTPRSMKDFDLLLWQISHKNLQFFKDEDGWFLVVNTPCNHLLPNGHCGIYDKRPRICREHSNECCEFDGPAEDDFELFFDSYQSLDDYCRKRFKKWDKRFKKWGFVEKSH